MLPEASGVNHTESPIVPTERSYAAKAPFLSMWYMSPMDDPMSLVVAAHQQAKRTGDPLADVGFLATTAGGEASVRPMSLHEVSLRGIGFVLTACSPKWAALEANQFELLLFYKAFGRQFRIRGRHERMDAETIATLWSQKTPSVRALEHYYGRIAPQSSPVASRESMLAELKALEGAVDQPSTFTAVRILPDRIESWIASIEDRLHERCAYTRSSDGWRHTWLVP